MAAENQPTESSTQGPAAYENWKAAERSEPQQYAAEVPLFSDASIAGEIDTGIGPYQLLRAENGSGPILHT